MPSELGEAAAFAAAALTRAVRDCDRNGRRPPPAMVDVIRLCVQVAAADGVGRQTRDRAEVNRQPDVVPAADSLLLTPAEVAQLLRCSTRTVRSLRAAGKLEPVMVGGLTRFRRCDVEAMAAAGPRSFRADVVAKDTTPGTRAGVCCPAGAGPINEPGAAA